MIEVLEEERNEQLNKVSNLLEKLKNKIIVNSLGANRPKLKNKELTEHLSVSESTVKRMKLETKNGS